MRERGEKQGEDFISSAKSEMFLSLLCTSKKKKEVNFKAYRQSEALLP